GTLMAIHLAPARKSGNPGTACSPPVAWMERPHLRPRNPGTEVGCTPCVRHTNQGQVAVGCAVRQPRTGAMWRGRPPTTLRSIRATSCVPRRTLKTGRSRQRQSPAKAFLLQQLGKQKRKLDRLLGVQSRIAEGVVAIVEVFFADGAGSTGTFRYILPGHLQMDATRIGALGLMNGEK